MQHDDVSISALFVIDIQNFVVLLVHVMILITGRVGYYQQNTLFTQSNVSICNKDA